MRALIAAGMLVCAMPWPAQAQTPPETAWPPPPGQARIEYVKQFTEPDDLGLSRSFGSRLVRFLAGGDDRRMARPYAIAAERDRLAVADPDAGAVHLFDTGRSRYRILTEAGNEPFRSPIGVAMSADRLFVADSKAGRVFVLDRKYKLERSLDGFGRPTSLAFDPVGEQLFVADTTAHEIHVFGINGEHVRVIGGRGQAAGEFNFPSHLAVSGDLLVVNDTMNFRVQIFDLEGRHLNSFGEYGLTMGNIAQAKGVAVDPDGHVYVADARTNRIQVFDREGALLLAFGQLGTGPGGFDMPAGLAFAGDTLYAADSLNRRVQVFRYLPEVP